MKFATHFLYIRRNTHLDRLGSFLKIDSPKCAHAAPFRFLQWLYLWSVFMPLPHMNVNFVKFDNGFLSPGGLSCPSHVTYSDHNGSFEAKHVIEISISHRSGVISYDVQWVQSAKQSVDVDPSFGGLPDPKALRSGRNFSEELASDGSKASVDQQ